MLKLDGIKCERKSIYADVATLNDIGFDIISTNSPKRGFFMASRNFELPQVRLLIDAVSSAGFITPNKTKDLVEKLESLVSNNQAKQLVSQVYINPNSKCNNEEIYYVIDSLHEAIINKCKVKFTYKRRVIDKKNMRAYTSKEFIVSPYALIWKEDHYYLVCNNEKYDNLMNLRLDRMSKIQELDEPARAIEEVSDYVNNLDVADYTSKMFNMFSGETGKVTLIFHLDIREEIMDRFGANIPFDIVDINHLQTTITAAISDGLVSWIMNFGDKIKVVEPSHLAQQIKEKALKIADLY
jgi:predicted DNA-binding transcriptional regulator YafY